MRHAPGELSRRPSPFTLYRSFTLLLAWIVTGWLDSLDGSVPELEERLNRFKRVLLSLGELRLRLAWLANEVRVTSPDRIAELLNALIDEGERGRADSREALIPVALWIAGHADQSDLEPLREVAFERRYGSLQRMIRRFLSVPERNEQDRPMLHDSGREPKLTLGERRSLARRAKRADFDRWLKDPHPWVTRQLLGNPRTTEEDVLRIVVLRPVHAEIIREVLRTEWPLRPRIRMGILQNPFVPPSLSVPLIFLCTRSERRELSKSTDLPEIVRLTLLDLEASPTLPP